MPNLKIVAFIVQLLSLLLAPASIIFGVITALSPSGIWLGIGLGFGGLVVAILLYGIGAVFRGVATMTENSDQMVESLNYIARRQYEMQQPQQYPPRT